MDFASHDENILDGTERNEVNRSSLDKEGTRGHTENQTSKMVRSHVATTLTAEDSSGRKITRKERKW